MEISVVYCDMCKRTTFSRDYYVPINETMHLLDNTIKNDIVNKGIFSVNHEKYLNENNIILPIQINGKRRAEINISKSLDNKEVEDLALNHQNVIKFLTRTPKKIIYIPNKIINIVI